LVDLVEQFTAYLRKQRGRTEGGVKTYRWNLEQFLVFVRARSGRLARLTDLERPTIQAWLDDMAAQDLGLNTLRLRVSTLSSFCAWLIRRELLSANPLAQIDRPARQDAVPTVPAPSLMDALVEEAKHRGRPRDLAIFLILRFTGMRRGSVASLRLRHIDPEWGLRAVRIKGGKTLDIPCRRSSTTWPPTWSACSPGNASGSPRTRPCSGRAGESGRWVASGSRWPARTSGGSARPTGS
jgi:integrase/recombinase XerC